mmetsp:Transcript_27783/g.50198  ORF Transcript_27783/g.50198 Transcript_27783/m.50198 type:complete len:239 (+) Transcript_27783:228-944(+)
MKLQLQQKKAAGEAEALGKKVPDMLEQAKPVVAAVEKSLKEAQDAEKAAEELMKKVEEQAYEAAKPAAEKEVKRLQAEAGGYYAAYLADLQLSQVPALDKTAQATAVSAAQKPYVDAENKVAATVETYSGLAQTLAAEVSMYQGKAKELANMAVGEQASGSGTLAAQHMMEAHKMLIVAKEKKARALKVQGLAEKINNVLPNYKQATEMAGDHARMAFSGLQLSSRRSGRLRHGSTEH